MKTNAKQDRQGVRTPADLERKYDLSGKEYAEIRQLATNAQKSADKASRDISEHNTSPNAHKDIRGLLGGVIFFVDSSGYLFSDSGCTTKVTKEELSSAMGKAPITIALGGHRMRPVDVDTGDNYAAVYAFCGKNAVTYYTAEYTE